MTASKLFLLTVIALALAGGALHAQTPAQVVVPAATAASSPQVAAVPAPPDASATLKLLQEIKAVNEETLRKQTATLQQLEELEKAAEQIKIYSKRS